jgi:dipicolinate synthase subunit B
MIGYAICGSFCTFKKSLEALGELIAAGYEVQPIMSERAYSTDTRFFEAEEFRKRLREMTKREIIHTVEDAERALAELLGGAV